MSYPQDRKVLQDQLVEMQAVLFDVDGTLYNQSALRKKMMLKFFFLFIRKPLTTVQEIKVLYQFRKDRETLRKISNLDVSLENEQYAMTAKNLGISSLAVRAAVRKWILEQPLSCILKTKYDKLDTFIKQCKKAGLLVGVFSDYPAREKIEALGLSKWVDLYLCSTDPEINSFKPSTRGLEMALKIWGKNAKNVFYIGDRLDVDAACAAKLGMPFVLIGNSAKVPNRPEILCAKDYENLLDILKLP